MPFEAGIAFEVQRAGRHHMLLLDEAPYRYQASLSDAAGLDPKIHHGSAAGVIAAVRAFLVAKSGQPGLPGAAYVTRRYALFSAQLPRLARSLHLQMRELKTLDYLNDFQSVAATWIRTTPP